MKSGVSPFWYFKNSILGVVVDIGQTVEVLICFLKKRGKKFHLKMAPQSSQTARNIIAALASFLVTTLSSLVNIQTNILTLLTRLDNQNRDLNMLILDYNKAKRRHQKNLKR